jgi:hypothetical protein
MERPMYFLHTAPVQSQLNPCNKDLYDKLVVPQIIKNIPVFCETQQFVAVFTAALQLFPLSER